MAHGPALVAPAYRVIGGSGETWIAVPEHQCYSWLLLNPSGVVPHFPPCDALTTSTDSEARDAFRVTIRHWLFAAAIGYAATVDSGAEVGDPEFARALRRDTSSDWD